jgi:hypothetical protein
MSERLSPEEFTARAIGALAEAHVALLGALHAKGLLTLQEARDMLRLACELRRPEGAGADEVSQRVLGVLIERVEREIGALEGPVLRVVRGNPGD